jgi:hypothetical protein
MHIISIFKAQVQKALNFDARFNVQSGYPVMYSPYWQWAVYEGKKSSILVSKKGKGHPVTGTEALYRPYGP